MTSAPHPLRIGFVSLGCAKNLVDSQIMAGVLLSEGMELAPTPDKADAIIVNTCAFIEDAREESIAHILEVCEHKRNGHCRALIVTGCLSQRYRGELRDSLPEVDAFIGLDDLEDIASVVRRTLQGENGILAVSDTAGSLFEPRRPGLAFSAGCYAYLKIAEGCNHPCAFCAIPAIRGRHRSRPRDALLSEARHLLSAGFRELDLISQDVTAYGRDQRDPEALTALLSALNSLDGDFWLRLLYGYPSGVTDPLLAAVRELPKVCPYLDIPVQHSHPDILRAMRRADTIDAVRALPDRARQAVPGITLRTTCLVGFPGETEAHFEDLVDYVRAARFDHLGVFAFSPEEGTPAHDLPGRPAPEAAAERRRHLLDIQRQVVERKAVALIETSDRVLLERAEAVEGETVWLARSRRQAPEVDGAVFVTGAPPQAARGDFLPVRYTLPEDVDLWASADPSA